MRKTTMHLGWSHLLRGAGRLALAVLLLAGLLGCGQAADHVRPPVKPEPEPAPSLISPPIADKSVSLAFVPLDDELFVSPAAASPDTIGVVQAAYPFGSGEGEAIVYALPEDPAPDDPGEAADNAARLMLGYRSAKGTYAIGPIAYGRFVPSIEETSLAGTAALKVAGICGANCPETYYIAERDGMPVVLLRVQANVAEADPDGDGTVELLASSGTAIQTSIIELADADGDAHRISDLAESLGAASVAFEPDTGLFAAYYAETTETIRYRYDGTALVRADGEADGGAA